MAARDFLRRHFFPRRHTTLLGAVVLAIGLRPLLGDFGAGPVVFSVALLLLLLVALSTIQIDDLVGEHRVLVAERRRRTRVAWTLGALAVAERVAAAVAPDPRLYLAGSISWLLFFAFVTWSLFRSLLRQRAVTTETLSMSISVYLFLGLTWGLLYIVLFQSQANAFSFGNVPDLTVEPSQGHHLVFPVLIYFSLTTLSTIGFGDITPLTLQARYAAVAEGITGQLYLAILVARLVGLQMNPPPRD